jgi:sterol desaturase/sphingolipid hydroxylase (fatty acid hydroxylase superfamily)
MRLSTQDYQIVAFFLFVAVFEIGERIWPAHPLDRWMDLKVDILSFAFALTVNRISNWLLRGLAINLTPPFLAGPLHYLQSLPGAVKIIIGLFLVDFVLYWIHRAQHYYTIMWRTHAWHHSIEQMYWFAGFRTSFFHSFIYNIPQVVIPVTFLHLSPAEAGIGYSIGLLIQFWEHTNWNVNIGPLAWLLVTPDYHRIHHSTMHRGMNLAPTFRIWDRLFGTFVDPAKAPEHYPLGLGEPVKGKEIPRMLVGI